MGSEYGNYSNNVLQMYVTDNNRAYSSCKHTISRPGSVSNISRTRKPTAPSAPRPAPEDPMSARRKRQNTGHKRKELRSSSLTYTDRRRALISSWDADTPRLSGRFFSRCATSSSGIERVSSAGSAFSEGARAGGGCSLRGESVNVE